MFIFNINQTRVNGIKTGLTMSFSLIFEVDGDSTISKMTEQVGCSQEGLLVQAKTSGSQFYEQNFYATNEKLCHGVRGPPFFSCECGGEGWFFIFKFGEWIVHCSLSSWTVESPLSMQALFICLFLRLGGGGQGSQVRDMFPKEFPIAPHFVPYEMLFSFSLQLGQRGRNSILQNKTFHIGEPPQFHLKKVMIKLFHCQKKN